MEGSEIKQAFDCSDLFPDFDHAHCRVDGDKASIQLWVRSESYPSELRLNIDKISNFLDQCRRYTSR